jgi:16S rRNA (cytosine967-C5)-methyltransferase
MLTPENDGQIQAFLASHPAFTLVPVAEVWKDAIGTPCPVETDTLQLTPKRHGTDGFFVAVMERKATVPAEAAEVEAPEAEAPGVDAAADVQKVDAAADVQKVDAA